MVLLGDSSSGKDFIIQILTGVFFPSSGGDRPRFPTEIICRPGYTATRATFRPYYLATEERFEELTNVVVSIPEVKLSSRDFYRIFADVSP